MKITFDNSVQMSAEQTNTYRAHAESNILQAITERETVRQAIL